MADRPDEPDLSPEMTVTDPEMRALLGMFDAPAFARRGTEVEQGREVIFARCRRERAELLEMVGLRLRQWAAAAVGPEDFAPAFADPIAGLWDAAWAPAPRWAAARASNGRRRAVAADLIASVERFNRRWAAFLDRLDLGGHNAAVDRYNRYYLIEKECVLGSHRLAARHFEPKTRLTLDDLRAEFPPLPVPRAG